MTDAQRLAQLEAEVAYLRSELALTVDVEAVHLLKDRFGLTRGQSVVLWALYRRRGRPLTNWQLQELALGQRDGEERHPSYLKVVISYIRRRVGGDAITTLWGDGYALSSAGRQLLAPILDPLERAA